jgi:hypothetical protein
MRGHDPLIAMRQRGFRPRMVFIHCGRDDSKAATDWHETEPDHAHIEVPDGEFITSLDMFFVVGLHVVVTGQNRRRVQAVADLCHQSKARSASTQWGVSVPQLEAA